jgi:hypothetical protein
VHEVVRVVRVRSASILGTDAFIYILHRRGNPSAIGGNRNRNLVGSYRAYRFRSIGERRRHSVTSFTSSTFHAQAYVLRFRENKAYVGPSGGVVSVSIFAFYFRASRSPEPTTRGQNVPPISTSLSKNRTHSRGRGQTSPARTLVARVTRSAHVVLSCTGPGGMRHAPV